VSLRIVGLATAAPPASLPQEALADVLAHLCADDPAQARQLAVLHRRAGIRRRGSVLLGEDPSAWPSFYPRRDGAEDRGPTTAERMRRFEAEAVELALPACRAALAEAEVEPAQLTHLVTVSCTGFFAPGPEIQLVRRLGLRPSVARTNVGYMGCHGALSGLQVALSHAASRADARVLVCCTELCGLHLQYGWNPDRAVGNVLFADGAAALVGVPAAGEAPAPWTVVDTASLLLPDSADDMTWRIGDHGFEMYVGPRVPGLIAGHAPDWIAAWLDRHGLSLRDVGSWAIHPGGVRILRELGAALGLEDRALAASRDVLGDHGNMSSATLLFVLQRLREAHAPRPCVALAFGPGLVAEGALLR